MPLTDDDAILHAVFEHQLAQHDPSGTSAVWLTIRRRVEGREVIESPGEALLQAIRKTHAGVRPSSERRGEHGLPEQTLGLDNGPVKSIEGDVARLEGGWSFGRMGLRELAYEVRRVDGAWKVESAVVLRMI